MVHICSAQQAQKPIVPPERDEAKNTQINPTALHCFKYNTHGHKAVNCPTMAKKCFLCGKQGHEARNCRSGRRRSGGQSKDGNPVQCGQVSASCLVQPPEVKPTDEEVKACIKDDKLLLACGKKIPSLSSACVQPLTGVRSQMPVVKGRVGEKFVDILRDTGCSGIVVKRDLVSEDQFTGDLMLPCSLIIQQGKFPSQRLMLINLISRAKWKRSVSLILSMI